MLLSKFRSRPFITFVAAVLAIAFVALSVPALAQVKPEWSAVVPQWGVQELVLHSRRLYKNAFADAVVKAEFRDAAGHAVMADGFFDGDGTWKVRLMPESQGRWSFKTVSPDPELNAVAGVFVVDAATNNSHGPVHVAETYHFNYADGTPYFLLGTTSYNWLNRDFALQDQTLASLAKSGFTKLRFGLFPKWYKFNRVDPPVFPYARSSTGQFDLEKFDPRFFNNVERRIQQLNSLGIQADIILFHPYDRWGFSKMDQAHNESYLRYVVARLGAYSNVWWTMANEYDLLSPRDWDRLASLVHDIDPYHHPIGIHNYSTWYDHGKPWIDHVILQDGSPDGAARSTGIARHRYSKPVVVDEYGYEGNNGEVWGQLSGPEELSRHWAITMAGGYASHGETYVHPGGVVWWAAGGELEGESPSRLAFLKSVMTSLPFQHMVPSPELVVNGAALAEPGTAYLFRFAWKDKDFAAPPFHQVRLEGKVPYRVELIDPWRMKTYMLGYTQAGDQAFTLPLGNAVLKITAAPDQHTTTLPIDTLAANFVGEKAASPPVDPTLFAAERINYSADFQISQLQQNPATNAVLEKYLPNILPRRGGITVFRLSDLPAVLKTVRQQQIDAIQFELEKIPVE